MPYLVFTDSHLSLSSSNNGEMGSPFNSDVSPEAA